MSIDPTTLPNDDGTVRPAVRCPGCGTKLEAPTSHEIATGVYGCGDCGQPIDPREARAALDDSPLNLRNHPALRRTAPSDSGRQTTAAADVSSTPAPHSVEAEFPSHSRPDEPDLFRHLGAGLGTGVIPVLILRYALDLPEATEDLWLVLLWAVIGGTLGLTRYLQAWASYRRAQDQWLMEYARWAANSVAERSQGW